MNKIEEDNFRSLIASYSNICISISTFTNLLRPPWASIFDPITSRQILMGGRYGSVSGCNIWVCVTMSDDSIKVSNQDITDVKEGKWSDSIPLELASTDHLERILKLKAFW